MTNNYASLYLGSTLFITKANLAFMFLKSLVLIFLCLTMVATIAQKPVISVLDSISNTSLRGLSVVNDKVVWCSGSNGKVAKSVNGGKTFVWKTVTGYEKRDFRDIEAFDANTAVIMAIAEPAVILKTHDGGITWNKVFEDTTKGMFLDAMDFLDDKEGVVVGDPVNGKFFFAYTKDSGDYWTPLNTDAKPDSGEAFFASSGSNIKVMRRQIGGEPALLYASGGTKSRLFYNEFPHGMVLPVVQGKESTGANSIAVLENKAIVVGGDFTNDTASSNNCVLIDFTDGINLSFPTTPPNGYRSSVVFIDSQTLLTCGTSGVDISYDGGNNWKLVSKESFHVVQKAKHGKSIFLAGRNGRIAKIIL